MVHCPGHFGFITLELPVFHTGYFKHAINVLQSICKECSRILIDETDRTKFTKLMRNRKDPQERESIRKEIQDMCKKVKYCPYCSAYNGTIKKIVGQALKIVHDKYSARSTPDDVMDDFVD